VDLILDSQIKNRKMIYTGYIDSEREPIKVGDYMTSPDEEYFVGMVINHNKGFRLSFHNGTYDELKNVANTFHIITENYAKYLYDLKIESDKRDFYFEAGCGRF
jgi:hypothetical protein